MELKKNYNNVTVLKIPNENFDPNLPEGDQNQKEIHRLEPRQTLRTLI